MSEREKPSTEERFPRTFIFAGNNSLYYFNDKILYAIDLKNEKIREITSNSAIDCFSVSPDEKFISIGNQKEFKTFHNDQELKELFKL